MDTAELLAEFATLMNRYGSHSLKVLQFLQEHGEDREFVRLAKVAQELKKRFEDWRG